MAVTIVSLSTSAFAVSDRAAFDAFCTRWDLEDRWTADSAGVAVTDLDAEGCESSFAGTDGADDDGDFATELAAQLADGWVTVCRLEHRERGHVVHWQAFTDTRYGVAVSPSITDGDNFDSFCQSTATLGSYRTSPAVVWPAAARVAPRGPPRD